MNVWSGMKLANELGSMKHEAMALDIVRITFIVFITAVRFTAGLWILCHCCPEVDLPTPTMCLFCRAAAHLHGQLIGRWCVKLGRLFGF